MSIFRAESESGSGIISSLIGILFVLTFLISLAKVTQLVLVTQQLNAVAQDSVRELAVGSAQNNPNSLSMVENHIVSMFPQFKNSLEYSFTSSNNIATFTIYLTGYTLEIWQKIGYGPVTLSASASAYMEQ